MILFKCDPARNTKCPKISCQSLCFETRYPEFAEVNDNGGPIVSYISEDELPKEVNDNEGRTEICTAASDRKGS